MIVTDRKYFMEKGILGKLDLMCLRCSGRYQHQNLIITDGIEGYGKTTLTGDCAYYMAHKLKRPLKLFFKPEELMSYSLKHEDEILIWDDAAFAALSIEAYNRIIIKLIKTIWLGRKKRHTYFINIQEVFRLKEPIVSRAIGLLHVYSPDEITVGKATYYNRRGKDGLYDAWQRGKRKLYKSFYQFRFTFPNAFPKIFDMEEYDTLKDKAIESIDDDKAKTRDKAGAELKLLKKSYATLPLKTKILAEHSKSSERTIQKWRHITIKEAPVEFTYDAPDVIKTKGYIEPKPLTILTGRPNEEKKQIKTSSLQSVPLVY